MDQNFGHAMIAAGSCIRTGSAVIQIPEGGKLVIQERIDLKPRYSIDYDYIFELPFGKSVNLKDKLKDIHNIPL